MQRLWRSFHGIRSHFTSFTAISFRSFEIFQQSTAYSSSALAPLSQSHPRNSLTIKELDACRDLAQSNYGIFQCGILGNKAHFRCMTTVGSPEPSSEQGSSAVSFETVHPQRIKFKRLDKTAKHIMNILDKEAVEKVRADREIPDIRPGYIIQLKVEVPENKRRVSIIKGIVIARRNAGLNSTFRLRRLVAGVGVESVFPLYSPNIKEMKVLEKKNVRRAKLYYLRDRMNALKK